MTRNSIEQEAEIGNTYFYFSAFTNGNIIFVKSQEDIHLDIINDFLDKKYEIKKVSEHLWETNIDLGKSYEIETIEELEEFKNNQATHKR